VGSRPCRSLARVLAAGRRLARGERMQPTMLLHKRYVAVIRTVEFSWQRDEHKQPIRLPPHAQHSVITTLLALA
jgi:hypothetical protein